MLRNCIKYLGSSVSNANVGFIGLGNMGQGMAQNLATKGHSVTVFDLDKSAVKIAEGKGAKAASSPREVAEKSETVVTMLPNNDIVRHVYTADDGIFKGIKNGGFLIDSSTIDPAVMLKTFSMYM